MPKMVFLAQKGKGTIMMKWTEEDLKSGLMFKDEQLISNPEAESILLSWKMRLSL